MMRLLALVILVASTPASAHDVARGQVTIGHAWSRPVAAGSAAAVGYLSISNRGALPDRLLGGSTSVAARLEIHQSTTTGGIMRMREVADGVALPPGSTVDLAPGGYHLMFVAPKRGFGAGDHLPATLEFARAGKVRVDFVVEVAPPAGKGSPAMTMR